MLIARADETAPFRTLDHSLIRELIGPASRSRNQTLAHATVAAGTGTERHFHARSEEIYVVLDGEGELEVDGERRAVAPGDAALIPPGAWHSVRAAAAADLVFLCCCAPGYADDDTHLA